MPSPAAAASDPPGGEGDFAAGQFGKLADSRTLPPAFRQVTHRASLPACVIVLGRQHGKTL